MAFQKPRILSQSEECTIRGKCLVAHATPEELMLLIGHFDLVIDKLRGALQTLAGAMPQKVFVYGAYGEMFTVEEPSPELTAEFETVDFKELLGE